MKMFSSCTGTLFVLLTLSVSFPRADSNVLSELQQLRERIDAIVDQQNAIDAKLKAGTSESDDTTSESPTNDDDDALAAAISQLTESIDALEAKQNELESQLDNTDNANEVTNEDNGNNATTVDTAAAAEFQEPEDFEGSSYYFSKGGMIQIDEAIGLCEKLGGYLVEIQSYSEYKFVLQLIKKYTSEGFISVYIAGTDVEKENTFKLQHSGVPLTFKIWGPLQPNNYGGDQNCMALFIDFDWQMDDDVCSNNDEYSRFICEVPVS